MTTELPARAHLVTGGFPPGSMGGHDHDYARLRLLGLLAEGEIPASVGNDFADVGKWLPVARLLITYVAGPYPDAAETRAIEGWLEEGGHWLALHGTSGGRAQRVEGARMRRTVKTEHHALLGGFFLTHPPIREIRVEVVDQSSPLARGLGSSFVVEDEPYFVELTQPRDTHVVLTADYGPNAAGATEGLYPADTSLLPDGHSRPIAYTRVVGKGGVAYIALGHCHNPAIRAARAPNPADATPPTFHGAWETPAFTTLLRNAIAWGMNS
jgi:type 1 glutamine amidotransferase